MECIDCRKNKVDLKHLGDKCFVCDFCKGALCEKCSNSTFSATELRVLQLKKDRKLTFLCETCTSMLYTGKTVKEIVNIAVKEEVKKVKEEVGKLNKETVEKYEIQMQEMLNINADLRKMVEEVVKTQNDGNTKLEEGIDALRTAVENKVESGTSFASVVKLKKPDPAVIIKPKDINQQHEHTRQEVKKAFDPMEIAVSRVKNVRDGGVVLEFKNAVAMGELKSQALGKLGDKYEVVEPKKQMPRMKIVGMSENYKPEEIEEKLRHQNCEYFTGGSVLRVVHVGQGRHSKHYFAYAEVDGGTYGKIMEKSKVNIGWDRCAVYDAVDVIRCYQCKGFGHKAKDCTNKLVCSKCGEQHRDQECNIEEAQMTCHNCKKVAKNLKLKIDYKHHALSRDCPTYQKQLQKKRDLIDFL